MDPKINGAKMLDLKDVFKANRGTGRAFDAIFAAYWTGWSAEYAKALVAAGSDTEGASKAVELLQPAAFAAFYAAISLMVSLVSGALHGNVQAQIDLELLIEEFTKKQASWLAMTAMRNMTAATPKAA